MLAQGLLVLNGLITGRDQRMVSPNVTVPDDGKIQTVDGWLGLYDQVS